MENGTVHPKDMRLFYEPPGTLRLTVGNDRSYPEVKLYQAWPLSSPNRFLSFLNGKGDEIVMVERLEELTPEARLVAEEELRRRYLTARVEAITSIRSEFGVTYWFVRTDRGDRDFVVQSLSESCTWLADHHVLISDVDGNRFEIPDARKLDPESGARLDAVL